MKLFIKSQRKLYIYISIQLCSQYLIPVKVTLISKVLDPILILLRRNIIVVQCFTGRRVTSNRKMSYLSCCTNYENISLKIMVITKWKEKTLTVLKETFLGTLKYNLKSVYSVSCVRISLYILPYYW